jgi:hypothetical protein
VLSFPAVDDRLSSLLPKLITALGIICISVSLSLVLVDDTLPFGVPYIVGIVLSFGGTIAWARRFDVRRKLRIAGYIFLLGLVVFFFVPNNVHGDGMLVGLVVLCGWLLSIVLVIMAAVAGGDTAQS